MNFCFHTINIYYYKRMKISINNYKIIQRYKELRYLAYLSLELY